MGKGGGQKCKIYALYAHIPSSTVASRATSASKGVTMYIAESNGRNFSEIISAKGRSFAELEVSLELESNGAA